MKARAIQEKGSAGRVYFLCLVGQLQLSFVKVELGLRPQRKTDHTGARAACMLPAVS